MAFDQSTRGRLQKLVNSCRGLLSDDTPLDGVTRGAVLKMIQTLADIDISAMHGTPMPTGGLLGVVCVLESWGWFDADVWKVLPKP